MRIICHPRYLTVFRKLNVTTTSSSHLEGVQLIEDSGEIRNLSVEELNPDRIRDIVKSSQSEPILGSRIPQGAYSSRREQKN